MHCKSLPTFLHVGNFLLQNIRKIYQNELYINCTLIRLCKNLIDRLYAGCTSDGSPASSQGTHRASALGPHVTDQCAPGGHLFGLQAHPPVLQSGPREAVGGISPHLTPCWQQGNGPKTPGQENRSANWEGAGTVMRSTRLTAGVRRRSEHSEINLLLQLTPEVRCDHQTLRESRLLICRALKTTALTQVRLCALEIYSMFWKTRRFIMFLA